jgi:hypothetical protein
MSSKILLTIGMPHFDDADMAWATIQSLRNSLQTYTDHLPLEFEIILVDDSPHNPSSKKLKEWIEGWGGQWHMRYVATPGNMGPAYAKNMVFQWARGEYTLCIDCHIFLHPEAIPSLLTYFKGNPQTSDLLVGPNILDNFQNINTHLDPVWRGEMWGIWKHDPTAFSVFDEPREVWGSGCGLMACRTAAWQGFNEHFRFFGAEEGYIHEKFRKAGHRVILLPFLRWVHKYFKSRPISFKLIREAKVRNYILGFQELGLPVEEIYNHFVSLDYRQDGESLQEHLIREHSVSKDSIVGVSESKLQDLHKRFKIPQANWDHIMTDPVNNVISADPPPAESKMVPISDPTKPRSLDDMFQTALKLEHDLASHMSRIRDLCGEGKRVGEVTRRRASTVSLLASRPTGFQSFYFGSMAVDPIYASIGKEADIKEEDIASVEINECDVFFFKCPHNYRDMERDLSRWAPKVKERIILHDTHTHGFQWEEDKKLPGTGLGILMFLRRNPEWFIMEHNPQSWGLTVLSRVPEDRPAQEIFIWGPGFGPGTEAKKILSEIGIAENLGCDCNMKATIMDIWGIDRCRQERDTLIAWFEEGAPRWGWVDKVRAATNAALQVKTFFLKSTNPYASIVDESIRRAELNLPA